MTKVREKPIYLKSMAQRLDVSISTLRRWDKEGFLVAHRTPTNRLFYTEEQVEAYFKDAKQ